MLRLLLPMAVTAVVLAAFATAEARGEDCYADWGMAAEIVKGRKLMTVQELAKSARDLPGEIVKTTLCKDGDDYIYKLVVRDPKGTLRTVVLDAAKGLLPEAK